MDSPRLNDIDLNKDQQREYERALYVYRQAITAIQEAGESVSVEQIKEAVEAREQLHKLLAEAKPRYFKTLDRTVGEFFSSLQRLFTISLMLIGQIIRAAVGFLTGQSPNMQEKQNEIQVLDSALKSQSRLIRRVVNSSQIVSLSEFSKVLETTQPKWRGLFKSAQPWHDRYDWLWRGISLVCFIWAVALLVDTVNRFLTGGVSTGGVAAILGTVFLTLLSSGGVLTSFGQSELERLFASFEISEKWWDEMRCLLSVLILTALIIFRLYGLPVASNCYVREPTWFWSHCFVEPAANSSRPAGDGTK